MYTRACTHVHVHTCMCTCSLVQAGGVQKLAAVLANLCRVSMRSDADTNRIEANMRCLKALIKVEEGLNALVGCDPPVCQVSRSVSQ